MLEPIFHPLRQHDNAVYNLLCAYGTVLRLRTLLALRRNKLVLTPNDETLAGIVILEVQLAELVQSMEYLLTGLYALKNCSHEQTRVFYLTFVMYSTLESFASELQEYCDLQKDPKLLKSSKIKAATKFTADFYKLNCASRIKDLLPRNQIPDIKLLKRGKAKSATQKKCCLSIFGNCNPIPLESEIVLEMPELPDILYRAKLCWQVQLQNIIDEFQNQRQSPAQIDITGSRKSKPARQPRRPIRESTHLPPGTTILPASGETFLFTPDDDHRPTEVEKPATESPVVVIQTSPQQIAETSEQRWSPQQIAESSPQQIAESSQQQRTPLNIQKEISALPTPKTPTHRDYPNSPRFTIFPPELAEEIAEAEIGRHISNEPLPNIRHPTVRSQILDGDGHYNLSGTKRVYTEPKSPNSKFRKTTLDGDLYQPKSEPSDISSQDFKPSAFSVIKEVCLGIEATAPLTVRASLSTTDGSVCPTQSFSGETKFSETLILIKETDRAPDEFSISSSEGPAAPRSTPIGNRTRIRAEMALPTKLVQEMRRLSVENGLGEEFVDKALELLTRTSPRSKLVKRGLSEPKLQHDIQVSPFHTELDASSFVDTTELERADQIIKRLQSIRRNRGNLRHVTLAVTKQAAEKPIRRARTDLTGDIKSTIVPTGDAQYLTKEGTYKPSRKGAQSISTSIQKRAQSARGIQESGLETLTDVRGAYSQRIGKEVFQKTNALANESEKPFSKYRQSREAVSHTPETPQNITSSISPVDQPTEIGTAEAFASKDVGAAAYLVASVHPVQSNIIGVSRGVSTGMGDLISIIDDSLALQLGSEIPHLILEPEALVEPTRETNEGESTDDQPKTVIVAEPTAPITPLRALVDQVTQICVSGGIPYEESPPMIIPKDGVEPPSESKITETAEIRNLQSEPTKASAPVAKKLPIKTIPPQKAGPAEQAAETGTAAPLPTGDEQAREAETAAIPENPEPSDLPSEPTKSSAPVAKKLPIKKTPPRKAAPAGETGAAASFPIGDEQGKEAEAAAISETLEPSDLPSEPFKALAPVVKKLPTKKTTRQKAAPAEQATETGAAAPLPTGVEQGKEAEAAAIPGTPEPSGLPSEPTKALAPVFKKLPIKKTTPQKAAPAEQAPESGAAAPLPTGDEQGTEAETAAIPETAEPSDLPSDIPEVSPPVAKKLPIKKTPYKKASPAEPATATCADAPLSTGDEQAKETGSATILETPEPSDLPSEPTKALAPVAKKLPIKKTLPQKAAPAKQFTETGAPAPLPKADEETKEAGTATVAEHFEPSDLPSAIPKPSAPVSKKFQLKKTPPQEAAPAESATETGAAAPLPTGDEQGTEAKKAAIPETAEPSNLPSDIPEVSPPVAKKLPIKKTPYKKAAPAEPATATCADVSLSTGDEQAKEAGSATILETPEPSEPTKALAPVAKKLPIKKTLPQKAAPAKQTTETGAPAPLAKADEETKEAGTATVAEHFEPSDLPSAIPKPSAPVSRNFQLKKTPPQEAAPAESATETGAAAPIPTGDEQGTEAETAAIPETAETSDLPSDIPEVSPPVAKKLPIKKTPYKKAAPAEPATETAATAPLTTRDEQAKEAGTSTILETPEPSDLPSAIAKPSSPVVKKLPIRKTLPQKAAPAKQTTEMGAPAPLPKVGEQTNEGGTVTVGENFETSDLPSAIGKPSSPVVKKLPINKTPPQEAETATEMGAAAPITTRIEGAVTTTIIESPEASDLPTKATAPVPKKLPIKKTPDAGVKPTVGVVSPSSVPTGEPALDTGASTRPSKLAAKKIPINLAPRSHVVVDTVTLLPDVGWSNNVRGKSPMRSTMPGRQAEQSAVPKYDADASSSADVNAVANQGISLRKSLPKKDLSSMGSNTEERAHSFQSSVEKRSNRISIEKEPVTSDSQSRKSASQTYKKPVLAEISALEDKAEQYSIPASVRTYGPPKMERLRVQSSVPAAAESSVRSDVSVFGSTGFGSQDLRSEECAPLSSGIAKRFRAKLNYRSRNSDQKRDLRHSAMSMPTSRQHVL